MAFSLLATQNLSVKIVAAVAEVLLWDVTLRALQSRLKSEVAAVLQDQKLQFLLKYLVALKSTHDPKLAVAVTFLVMTLQR